MDIKMGGNSKEKEAIKLRDSAAFIQDLHTQMSGISRRYKNMEEKFQKIFDNIIIRNEEWDDSIKNFDVNVSDLRDEIEFIRNEVTKNINSMEKIIVKFKDAAKNTDKDASLEALNNWKVEGLVTKNRFKKLLLEELDKRT